MPSARAYQRVVIAGLGLLGGSLALSLRRRGLARRVVAWGRPGDAADLGAARRAGLVGEASTRPDCARGADLIVLGAPFRCFEGQLRALAGTAPAGCLVTDVGSVKGAWVGRWHRAAGPLRYVASHPMAGGEKKGWRHARAELFEGAACVVTPLPATDKPALGAVDALWRAMGMRVTHLDPGEHDRIIAGISHLPHAAAAALVRAAHRTAKPGDFALAGRGWLDTTRVAASDPGLWTDILAHQREPLDRALGALEGEVRALRGLLRDGRRGALRTWLARASALRRADGGRP